MLKILSLLLCCGTLKAEGDFSFHAGLNLGLGSQRFYSAQHPDQPNRGNLFALLSGQTVLEEQEDFSGGLGLGFGAMWKGILGPGAELWWLSRSAKQTEDLGSGIVRGTEFIREALEGTLQLRLAWPFALAKGSLSPYLSGGVYGNRVTASRKMIGLAGEDAKTFAWDGTPNEDWGWVSSFGLEFKSVLSTGLEIRYYEGQKDLDPKGVNELRPKMILGLLHLGI
jgi:hypothetical protein